MMHYTLFGESHGPAVGVLLTDVPPGLPVDEVFIREQLLRRMGQGGLTTARQEKRKYTSCPVSIRAAPPAIRWRRSFTTVMSVPPTTTA